MTTPGPARPGHRVTADRLNGWLLPGRTLFRATRDDAQSIGSGTNPSAADALIWQTIELDELEGWDAGQPTRWTCTRAGWYRLSGGVSFAGSTSGTVRAAGWLVTGAFYAGGHTRVAASPTNTFASLAARVITVQLAVGDYVQLAPGQNSGGTLDTGGGGTRPYMEVAGAREA